MKRRQSLQTKVGHLHNVKKQYYLKTRTIITDTDRVADKDSNCMNFIMSCDSTGSVYKIVCRDYKVVYKYEKGIEYALHKAVDFDNDIINFIVVKDSSINPSAILHYRCIINEIEGLKMELKRNYNMKAKVLEWANKYRIKTKYVIN